MADNNINIQITADVSNATAGIDKVKVSLGGVDTALQNTSKKLLDTGKKIDSVGKKLSGFGKDLTAWVTVPVVGAGVAAFKMASEYEDNLTLLRSQFGESSKAVEAWAKDSRKNLLMSEKDAISYANTFGLALQGAGFSAEESSKMAMDAVQMMADVSSASGKSVAESYTAVFSYITGETESVKRFGGNLTEAGIEAYMLSQGITKSYKELSEQERILIRQNALWEDFNKMSGDVQRNQGSSTSTFKEFTAVLTDLAVTFGTKLLPIFTPYLEKINDVIQKFIELDPAIQNNILKIAGIVAVIGPTLMVIGKLISVVGATVSGFGMLGSVISFLVSPIGLVIVAIGALVAGLVWLYTSNEEFRAKVNSLWQKIKDIFKGTLDNIKVIIDVFVKVVRDLWNKHGSEIKAIIQKAWDVISSVIQGACKIISGIISVFAGLLTGDWSKIWDGIKKIASGAWQLITGGIGGFLDLINSIWASGLNILNSVWSKVWGGLGKLFDNAMSGIKKGIQSAIDWVVGKFADMKLSIPKPKLPKFSITGSFSLNPLSVPKLGMTWFKNGGIVDTPTAGVFGEAGKEAFVPMYNPRAMRDLAGAVVDYMPDNTGGGSDSSGSGALITGNNFYIREEADIHKVAVELARLEDADQRGKGRNNRR